MRVGILQTGAPPEHLASRSGSYVEMFQRFLGPCFGYLTFDARQEQYPAAIADCDAYVITGPASGVNGHEWIKTLQSFIRTANDISAMPGFCFGHQIMAEAFRGRVLPSANGWGIGLHRYEVRHGAAWKDAVHRFSAPASHRDQVVEPPEDAIVLASSASTPFAALLYPGHAAVSFQCHPESGPEYAAALIQFRRGAIYSQAEADSAVASLRAASDRARVAAWMQRFLASAEHSRGRR